MINRDLPRKRTWRDDAKFEARRLLQTVFVVRRGRNRLYVVTPDPKRSDVIKWFVRPDGSIHRVFND